MRKKIFQVIFYNYFILEHINVIMVKSAKNNVSETQYTKSILIFNN